VTPPRFRQPAPQTSRRCFLRQAGVAAAAVLLPVGTVLARSSKRRSLSLVHTHTGERLSTVYFEGGQYMASELSRINWLLRDFRTGDVHPIDPAVLDILADLRTLADRDEPYEVISGYRSPKTTQNCIDARAAWPSVACTSRAVRSTFACRASRRTASRARTRHETRRRRFLSELRFPSPG